MKKTKKELSVIIPHKNSVDYLIKLVRSIPKSDQLEIIIIDDHSEIQNFKKITKAFSSDVRIKIIKNKSEIHSAGKARNLGLATANGKWITFADADDNFLDNFIIEFDKIKNSNYDAIYFQPTIIEEDNEVNDNFLIKLFDKYNRNPSETNAKMIQFYMDVPWSKFIKKSLIDEYKISFDEVKKNNDVLFSKKIALKAKNIAIKNEQIYCYFKQPFGITKQKDSESYLSSFDVISRTVKLMHSEFSANQLLLIQPDILFDPMILFLKTLLKRPSMIIKLVSIYKRNKILSTKYFSVKWALKAWKAKKRIAGK